MKIFTTCLILSAFLLTRADACTGLYAYQNGVALAGNNEDYWNPNIKIWFTPAEAGSLGRVYFGFDNLFPQGGMNEKGLFFDGFATQPVPVTQSKHKKQFDRNLLDRVMAECSTVDEVLQEFEKYNLEFLERAMLFYADRLGNSVIIEGDSFVRKKGPFQICTNFYQSLTKPENYTCYRYKAANEMLASSDGYSVDLFRRILDAAHVEGPSYTLYSNICDLTHGKIYLYHFHDFENVVELDLDDELKKGHRVLDIPSLFPEKEAWTSFQENREKSLADQRKSITAKDIDPAVYDEYVGRYKVRRNEDSVQIDVVREDNKLYMHVEGRPQVEILPRSSDHFFQLDYFGMSTITFDRKPGGALTGLKVERGKQKFVAERMSDQDL